MLKKTTLLLLFFVSISFSQNNLAVTYKVKIEDEKEQADKIKNKGS